MSAPLKQGRSLRLWPLFVVGNDGSQVPGQLGYYCHVFGGFIGAVYITGVDHLSFHVGPLHWHRLTGFQVYYR